MEKTCEACGLSFNERANHQCDTAVLEDREKQREAWEREELGLLEREDMRLSDFL